MPQEFEVILYFTRWLICLRERYYPPPPRQHKGQSMAKPDPHYALEKLGEAVYDLATGTGPVQERLCEAFVYLHRIRPEDIPDPELRRILGGIKDDLTFDVPKSKEGRLVPTLLNTSNKDASAIAARILDLYQRMDDLLR
jgi:hypothetical protein